jgi:hypothetical protein
MQEAASQANRDMLPRGVLVAIGVLVFLSMAGTAAVRWSGVSIHEPDAVAATCAPFVSRTVPTAASS